MWNGSRIPIGENAEQKKGRYRRSRKVKTEKR